MLHGALEWPREQLISMPLSYAHSLPHPQEAMAGENPNSTTGFIASFALGNLSDLLIFLSMNGTDCPKEYTASPKSAALGEGGVGGLRRDGQGRAERWIHWERPLGHPVCHPGKVPLHPTFSSLVSSTVRESDSCHLSSLPIAQE